MKNKGLLVINKPESWTSFDVVNKIKHITKIKQIGHLGTLDPMATGVLLITIGKATKLFNLMQEKEKSYIAEFQFGEETDTLDATGKIIKADNKQVSREEIEKILPNFIGEIAQTPPKYSAKSINGVRAYDLARSGKDFELKPKNVHISSIKILNFENNLLKLEIICGSGTYIRSLGRDIAHALNSLATMTSLIRTRISKFSILDAHSINELNEINIDNYILPIKDVVDYDVIQLTAQEIRKILNGQTIDMNANNGTYKLNNEQDTIALIKVENKRAKMSLFLG